MPWKETTQVQERIKFIEDWLADEYESMAAVCAAHGVSRKTGYKWLERFKGGGLTAMHDQPRRWRTHAQATPRDMVELIVGIRRVHPTWGPRKLRVWLTSKGYDPPAASTIGAILKREGCVRPKRRRAGAGEYSDGLSAQDAPNEVWGADFKGWFKLTSGASATR